jgi:alkanesulfonate monooxygenase SsuD/methylene tetrahydromethanopterin reductase-like flavin-dependent oxidoreductase (luciferase family)
MGDGWLNNITSPEVYRECLAKMRGYASEAGRDPESIEPGLYFTCGAGGKAAQREGEEFLSRYYGKPYQAVARAMLCVLGDWDQIIDRLEAYRDAGARTVVVRFATRDQLGHLEGFAAALERRKLFAAI